jgi:hypothetical protein
MAGRGRYFYALLGTSLLGSFLNIFLWYIEKTIFPNEGFSFGFEFYLLYFFISVFFSFIATIPVIALISSIENNSQKRSLWWVFLLTYLVYFAVMYFFFRFRDKDAIVGYHIYILSGFLSIYYFVIYQNKLPIKDQELLDD